ncbi:MAG TPA: histidine kinase dimerization/phospho-acceptor domain-containing protein, partial [Polyangiaceae bacterium]
MRKHASLRSMMVAVTVIVTVLALLTAGALVALTNALHRATTSSAAATHSVRLAQEAEIDLLLHERTGDEIVKRDLEEGLRRKLTEARKFVTGAEEERLLARAVAEVEAYVATTRDPGKALELAAREEAAYEALASLVTINVAQSHASQADAERWEDMGNVLGMSLVALVIVVSGTVIIWLRRRAFQPVFELATVMERFGRGERDVRAAERGVRELREMSARFNEMAAAISAQREAQMALLGGVAHDLRNPLSALRMSIALLQTDEALPADARIPKTVARFGRQIERMDRMLGDFLDLANIEA